jgi:glycosyltransferase involved in cell wall biosynthesis
VRQYAGRVNDAPSKHLILLDATAISAQRGGVGRYVEELARQSAAAGAPVVVVCQPRDEPVFASFDCDLVVAPSSVQSVPLRFIWEQFGLPALARRLGATVIHSPHYTFPLVTTTRRVVTVHDLTFWSYPERHSWLKRTFFRWWISASARRHLDVIVPSRATGQEYERVVRARHDRITVAYHGVDTATFHPPTETDVTRFARKHGVTEWVAFLGTIEPRKNIVPLIEGFQSAVAATTRPPALLLAGAPGWDHTVTAAIDAAVRSGFDVRHLGYIPLEELSAFLGGATVVAYPSEGEGFGLPVLEAMSCGAPVLTTRSLSLPEVGGDAVAYTDTSAPAIGVALSALIEDPARRAELSRSAIDRAAEFTWSSCVSAHRAVWER